MQNQSRRTVLVADDTPAIRLLLRRTLETQAYRVVEAANVNETWAQLATERPDVLIMELRLPGLDALDVCRALRRDERMAHTRVIVLTTIAGEETKRHALSAGADLLITKPFRPLLLLDELARLLDQPSGRASLRETC